MGFPWYLKPDLFLHKELLDTQKSLSQAARDSSATDRKQDRQIKALEQRVAELEAQLLALETFLSEKGILPPPPEEDPPEAAVSGQLQANGAALFPARTARSIACPCCGKCQVGDLDFCVSCGTPFRYENEA